MQIYPIKSELVAVHGFWLYNDCLKECELITELSHTFVLCLLSFLFFL